MTLQGMVQIARRLLPRGWSPVLRGSAMLFPGLRSYPAVMHDGDCLWLDLREDGCHTYFYHGCLPHERGTESLMRQALLPGNVFIDVGANIGYFTRRAAQLVGPQGHVRAFEPLPTAFRLLLRNTHEFPHVESHATAVGRVGSRQVLHVNAKGPRSSLLSSNNSIAEITVDVVTLDDALDGLPVDFVKLDCEGWELEALQGALRIVDKWEPILYFELLNEYATSGGYDLGDFREVLAPRGYAAAYVSQVDPDGSLFIPEPSAYIAAIPRAQRYRSLIDQIRASDSGLW